MNNIKLTQNNNQRVVLYQLIILSLLVFNTLVSCSNSSKISRVNQKQIIGVQLLDGQVVTAHTSNSNKRSRETLNNFVEKWVYLSFNWTTADLTVEVEETKAKIPGNVYASTFPITTKGDFRNQYITEFSQLFSQVTKNLSNSNIQSVVDIESISDEPVEISDGVWEVIVVSTWTGLDPVNGKRLFEIPFNKKLRLKAIPMAGKASFLVPENIPQFQRIINEINQYGLQIIAIENYDPQ